MVTKGLTGEECARIKDFLLYDNVGSDRQPAILEYQSKCRQYSMHMLKKY